MKNQNLHDKALANIESGILRLSEAACGCYDVYAVEGNHRVGSIVDGVINSTKACMVTAYDAHNVETQHDDIESAKRHLAKQL